MSENGPEDERLQAIYDRLDELDPTTFEADAAKLLHGLGFEEKMMAKATKDMSGRHCSTAARCGRNVGDGAAAAAVFC